MRKLKSILTGITISSVFMMFCLAASAQSKPKGKPWPAPESAVKMKNPVKSDDVSQGKDIWAQHCKSCHGAKGKGDGTKAAKIDISCGDFSSPEFQKETDGELFWKTTDGRKPMPSFKEKLSDKERWAVVNFMRTLK
ncbi:MAG: c-type cytochrome [Bacteroidia bacterium]